jgi:phospholipase C
MKAFLRVVVFLSVLAAIGPVSGVSAGTTGIASPTIAPPDAAATIPTSTPIKHFVTLMESNHSFDSLFGTYPGADGIPSGICMRVDLEDPNNKQCIQPFPLTHNGADLDHTHTTFMREYNAGHNDGFIYAYRQRGEQGDIAMGHYGASDIPFQYSAAGQYVLYDKFFTSASAGSVPNRMYWVTGKPGIQDFVNDDIPKDGWGNLPTIFDELQKQGVSWKFYIENYNPKITYRSRGAGGTYAQFNWAPLLSYGRYIDDPTLSSHIVDLNQYYVDLKNNQLPAVSYVVMVGKSLHPPSSLLSGDRKLSQLVNALMMSPSWSTSAFQWAYDDWGGWYDHVPPPQIDAYGYGFRTAALMVSPYAKKGYIDHQTHDFTSILKFIEDNWQVPALAKRDASAVSIATALDFSKPPRPAGIISSTPGGGDQGVPVQNRMGIYAAYTAAFVIAVGVVLVVLVRNRGVRPIYGPRLVTAADLAHGEDRR